MSELQSTKIHGTTETNKVKINRTLGAADTTDSLENVGGSLLWQGETVSTGDAGSSGSSGSSGNTGASGTSGSSGSSGNTGASGTSGTSGSSGNTGASGTSGTSGSSGNAGASGTSGTSGSSGNTGASGTSGSSGTSTSATAPSMVYGGGNSFPVSYHNNGATDGNYYQVTFGVGSPTLAIPAGTKTYLLDFNFGYTKGTNPANLWVKLRDTTNNLDIANSAKCYPTEINGYDYYSLSTKVVSSLVGPVNVSAFACTTGSDDTNFRIISTGSTFYYFGV